MPKLFTYGTLQDVSIQQDIFNRILEGAPDKVMGYAKESLLVNGTQYPVIVRSPGKMVSGTVFMLTEEDMIRADEYETSAYKRIVVRLVSGEEAWVYIAAEKTNQ